VTTRNEPAMENETHKKSLELLDKFLKEVPQEERDKMWNEVKAIGYSNEGPTVEEYFEALGGNQRIIAELKDKLTRNEAITSELVLALKETNGRLKLCQSLLMYRYKNNPELGDTEHQTDERIRKNEELLARLTKPTE
jgi:hypothetical protein